jgi:hypothetical protein
MTSENDPFADDRLNRKPDAELLTKLISNQPRPAVISIDAPWGGGKTTFVTMWRRYLTSLGHPTVYYNAWETDFVEDPLVSFIGEFEEDIAALHGGREENTAARNKWKRVRALAMGVIRSTGPLAMRIATQGLLSVPDVKSALGFVSEADAEISEYAAKMTEERLAAYATEKSAVKAFRETLREFIASLSTTDLPHLPVVIFVDELDRCRPSFAIALLERIKHLFAVEDVVFVLALDKDQLAHTVRAIYGQGFAAEGYLRRFIDFDFHLSLPRGKNFAEYLAEKHRLTEVYSANEASRDEYQVVVPAFSLLSDMYSLSLRDQEQAFSRIVLALKSAETPRHYLYTQLVILLGVLRMGAPELYRRYMSGSAGVREILKSLETQRGGEKYLDRRVGEVALVYLLMSSDRGSDAKDIIAEMKATAANENAPTDEQQRAKDLLQLMQILSGQGGEYALKTTLARLEKINRQVEVEYY